METFFLLRHGETAWNLQRRIMGRLDIPLNRQGIEQAQRIAKLIPAFDIDAIYTSPLKRAVQTARLLAKGNPLSILLDAGLTELAFGRWAGCYFDDLVHDPLYHRFLRSPLTTRIPGGETIKDVQRRGLRVMQQAAKQIPQGRFLFVSHGDVMRAMICHCLRLPLEEFRRLRVDTGSLSVVQTDGDWAEIKYINYVPEITRISKEPYIAFKPTALRKGRTRVRARQNSSTP